MRGESKRCSSVLDQRDRYELRLRWDRSGGLASLSTDRFSLVVRSCPLWFQKVVKLLMLHLLYLLVRYSARLDEMDLEHWLVLRRQGRSCNARSVSKSLAVSETYNPWLMDKKYHTYGSSMVPFKLGHGMLLDDKIPIVLRHAFYSAWTRFSVLTWMHGGGWGNLISSSSFNIPAVNVATLKS